MWNVHIMNKTFNISQACLLEQRIYIESNECFYDVVTGIQGW